MAEKRYEQMRRRDFLATAAGAATAVLGTTPLRAQTADSSIDIFLNEPLGTISRNIYGHFTEHIGGVIYDGVWVGEDSKIPNVNGIRKALVDALKRIKAPVIRWPGGCFADSYDWKDGVGPARKRPTRTNFWEVDPDAKRLHEQGPQLFDPNAFGTNEFARFCKLSGGEPYLAANLRSLPALDFDHWVSYCNSPTGSTTYAEMREADGSREPFNVQYWGVGNESWGCGGNFRPDDYASEFRRYTEWIPSYGVDLYLIASGPNDNDTDWTRQFFHQIFTPPHADHNRHFRGWSVHHYSRVPGDDALHFGEKEWYGLFRSADQMEQIILDNWSIMGEYDRGHAIRLVVDEYGPWHPAGTEIDPSHIFGQQITVRDALATAMTLDCFNRHPEKVSMANCAQLINNLNALFLAHGDHFWTTPNFDVFEMYTDHQDAQALRAVFAAPQISSAAIPESGGFWGLKGSASLSNSKRVTITAVNPSVNEARETRIVLHGANAASVSARVLTAPDIHAHNTFENPNAVQATNANVAAQNGELHFTFPAASVSKLTIQLG